MADLPDANQMVPLTKAQLKSIQQAAADVAKRYKNEAAPWQVSLLLGALEGAGLYRKEAKQCSSRRRLFH